MVPRFIKAALKNEPITLYGDGLQTRSFCYVDDNIEACIKAMNSEQCVNDVLNIGSDIEMTILDLAKKVIEVTGSKSSIIHLPPLEEGDMTRRCPDTSKMKSLLQRELIQLEVGIKKLMDYYENRN